MATILVVEDNATNMKLSTFLLESADYTVIAATNAETGVTLAREEHPDLIRQIEAWSASHSTAERLSILASAWKRLAIVEACCSDAARVRSHLKQAVKCYVKAVERSTRNKSYPLSQAALARLLGGWTSRAIPCA